MEERSPRVPAELAPFRSQHHKWSWSRPEWSPVRLPLCADSIRNNCILASLHSSPFTTVVWHFTVFLCSKLQYGPKAGGRTLQQCCYWYWDTETPLMKTNKIRKVFFSSNWLLWSSCADSSTLHVLSLTHFLPNWHRRHTKCNDFAWCQSSYFSDFFTWSILYTGGILRNSKYWQLRAHIDRYRQTDR